jgi:hypothetical protein
MEQASKRERENLKKRLDATSSKEDTDKEDRNISDNNEKDHIETDCEKFLICEDFGKD